MVKPPSFLPIVALAVRLGVLVMPLPLLAATSSPIASCVDSEVKASIGKLATAGKERDDAIAKLSQCSNVAGSLIWELENNPSVEARSAAIEVLEQIGTPAVDELIKLLNDRSKPEVARSLAIGVLSDIAQAEKTVSPETIESVLKDRRDDSQERDLIRINADQALRQLNSPTPQEMIGKWIEKNPNFLAGIAVILGAGTIYLLVLWQKPLWLLHLPAQFKFKFFQVAIDVPIGVLHWLKYRPRVLDRWISKRLEQSQADFKSWESKLELNADQQEEAIYIPIPLSVDGEKKNGNFSFLYLQDVFKSQTCLLIVGEGGTGKSSLACQIARWGAGWKTVLQQPVQLLCKHPMLPIPISWDLKNGAGSEENPLLNAILQQLPEVNPLRDRELVKALLEKQRILVIVDRFSELSKDTQEQIKKEVYSIPIKSLIITSRREYDDLGRRKVLSPRRLTGSNIVYFIETYLQRKGILDRVKGDESTFVESVWQDLRSMLNKEEEDATVLLVRLYLDRVVEVMSHESIWENMTENWSNKLVKSIPELMDSYLNRLNKTVKQDNRSYEDVKKSVQTIASTCLEQNGYQPKAVPREKLIQALVTLDKDDSTNQKQKEANALKCLEEYLDEKLKLLEISDSNEVKISLDPLAEHFAALQFVDACQAPDSEQNKEKLWREFLEKIDNSNIDGKDQVEYWLEIKGFLKAVRKCCDVRRDVPQFALDELDKRIEPDETKREEARQKRQIQRVIADLQDNDRKYRERAIEDLKEIGASAKLAACPLLNILESRSEALELRESALEALKEISPDAEQFSPTLITILENQNEEVELRRSVLKALQGISLDVERFSSRLISILENQSDAPELRRSAADFLGTLDEVKQTIEPQLVKIVEDRNEAADVRLRSVWALRQLGKTIPHLVARIKDDRIELVPLQPAPAVRIEDRVEGLKLEMVQIPAGSFRMGSAEGEKDSGNDEYPRHEVTITKPFWMGKYPVTQAQWRAVAALPEVDQELDPNLFNFEGDDCPVKQISWLDAIEFCQRLTNHTGRNYRLPSEAEWEYACRANTETPYHFGTTITPVLANYYESGFNRTTPVGYFAAANPFGLYDMHGNVWEWCADHWHENYQGAPSDGSAWLTDDENAPRVVRGGAWLHNSRDCRSASRYDYTPKFRNELLGFRVVCGLA